MKTWWQRKSIGIDGILLWVLVTLVVGVLVLWATTGRAEELDLPTFCNTDLGNGTRIDSAYLNGKKIAECQNGKWVHLPSRCEQRMEAAMRAMDEFVQWNALTSVEAVYRSPQAELRLEIERLNRRDAAQTQWKQVKEECWSKP